MRCKNIGDMKSWIFRTIMELEDSEKFTSKLGCNASEQVNRNTEEIPKTNNDHFDFRTIYP